VEEIVSCGEDYKLEGKFLVGGGHCKLVGEIVTWWGKYCMLVSKIVSCGG